MLLLDVNFTPGFLLNQLLNLYEMEGVDHMLQNRVSIYSNGSTLCNLLLKLLGLEF
jgi:hypothetical protein